MAAAMYEMVPIAGRCVRCGAGWRAHAEHCKIHEDLDRFERVLDRARSEGRECVAGAGMIRYLHATGRTPAATA